MIKKATLFTFLVGIIFLSNAQQVKEKDIIGTWKIVFDIKDDLKEEADEADTMLEEIIIKSVSGFVGGLLDDLDIYLEFKKNKDVLITVNAYGESETGTGRWFINKSGFLEIEDDEKNEKIDFSTDDEWKLIDGILVEVDENDRNVYMAKVN